MPAAEATMSPTPAAISAISDFVLPTSDSLSKAQSSIYSTLPLSSNDEHDTRTHLDELCRQGLNASSKSSRYYGFIVGGTTPIAQHADNLVTEFDQNVQVHLPQETLATVIEDAALKMLCQLVRLDPNVWIHRTFPTGATASHILGLACAREHLIQEAGKRLPDPVSTSVAELGLVMAMKRAHLDQVNILTTVPHSSLKKAASVVGFGHASVKDVAQTAPSHKHKFDFDLLEAELKQQRTASIIVVSCAEVNTGLFATEGLAEFQQLRKLADQYGAWIHVDAAFGLLARALDTEKHTEFAQLMRGAEGLELADSITGDAHKLFNVPYDCGIFLSKHLEAGQQTFQNPGAAYLSTSDSSVPSPLNIGIENSRRFRALPVYANLVRYGVQGLQDILIKQIKLARRIASFFQTHESYELLPPFHDQDGKPDTKKQMDNIFMVVCFRAKNEDLNKHLAASIKQSRKIYVSGTAFWDGKPATRFAVSNWQADEEVDFPVIQQVLEEVARQ